MKTRRHAQRRRRRTYKHKQRGGATDEDIAVFFSLLEDTDRRRLVRFFEEHPDFDASVRDTNGHTALWVLLSNNIDYETPEIIKLLMDHGATVDETDERGWNLLFVLATNHDLGDATIALGTLLDAGLDINSKTRDGKNLYHVLTESHPIPEEEYSILFDYGLDFMYVHENRSAMRDMLIYLPDDDMLDNLFAEFPEVATATIEGVTYFHVVLIEGEVHESVDNIESYIPHLIYLFLSHGANPNKPDAFGNTFLHTVAEFSTNYDFDDNPEDEPKMLDIIQILLNAGADPAIKNAEGLLPMDMANEESIKNALAPPTTSNTSNTGSPMWEGWTRADIAHMDDIFHEAIATNSNLTRTNEGESLFSMCPVCMKYIQHETGTCMYMTHDCKKSGGFYHKGLYEKYKYFKVNAVGERTNQEVICWCTLCGRICKDHQHYALAGWDGPTPRLLPPGRPYETDCRISNGGGGKPEKLARYRRLREFVAEDMNALVGTMKKQDAYEQMVQEMWNAPLVSRAARIRQIETSKEWNIPATSFPLPPSSNTNKSAANAPNIPYTGQLPLVYPTETDQFTNAMHIDDADIIQFRHDGNQHAGPGQQISREAFVGFLKDVLADPAGERFGKCWQYATAAQEVAMSAEQKALVCRATLHPEEVKAALDMSDPEQVQLYEGYRKQFNAKLHAQN